MYKTKHKLNVTDYVVVSSEVKVSYSNVYIVCISIDNYINLMNMVLLLNKS